MLTLNRRQSRQGTPSAGVGRTHGGPSRRLPRPRAPRSVRPTAFPPSASARGPAEVTGVRLGVECLLFLFLSTLKSPSCLGTVVEQSGTALATGNNLLRGAQTRLCPSPAAAWPPAQLTQSG